MTRPSAATGGPAHPPGAAADRVAVTGHAGVSVRGAGTRTPQPLHERSTARFLALPLITRLPQPLRERSTARFLALVLMLGLFGLAVLLVGQPELSRIPAVVDRLGPLAPVAAVLVGALLLVVLVPRTLLTVAWGALFGPLGGAAYALAAALLAAALGFAVGRLLGREFVAVRVRGRLARLDTWFARQTVLGVITVRLLPLGGFGLVSYGYGTTGARVLPFLAGSVLASVPSAFGYAAVGAAIASPASVNLLAVAPAGFGLVAAAVIVRRWRRAANRGLTHVTPDVRG